MKSLKELTRKELLEVPVLETYGETLDKVFTGFVIVPMGELHYSGFECMRFVLTHHDDIIGAVGGYCDVVHLNGIGGYGRDFKNAFNLRAVPVIDWSIDLLPGSHCLRVFSSHKLALDAFICSDFIVYDAGRYRRES